jgi:hypothetical protein
MSGYLSSRDKSQPARRPHTQGAGQPSTRRTAIAGAGFTLPTSQAEVFEFTWLSNSKVCGSAKRAPLLARDYEGPPVSNRCLRPHFVRYVEVLFQEG